MSNVIEVKDLSKIYRLGEVGTGSLSQDLNRWWHTFRGKEDPYKKLADNNDRTLTGTSDFVYALKDISFNVKQGEVLGIIGKNGAGKSTLLKLLSRITSPTYGSIYMKGRVASLLEVGTGFHPELTGRENIYLNGSILGMTKQEISRKLDEIVFFSGCSKYVDTPVKRYSSGMTVRLAFAVAAHLEPEILIVDEVLAVGDAEFQKKAIGKMQEVSSGGGRTVLFVSHNMAAVRNLCPKSILLHNGEMHSIGESSEIINTYLNLNSTVKLTKDTAKVGNKKAEIIALQVITENEDNVIRIGSSLKIEVLFKLNERLNQRYDVSIHLFNEDNNLACILTSVLSQNEIRTDSQKVVFHIPCVELNKGNYIGTVRIIENRANSAILKAPDLFNIMVSSPKMEVFMNFEGVFIPKYEAKIESI